MNSLGLFFAGGAFLGAAFEAAASLAVDDLMASSSVTECAYYSGISSGSFIASFISSGVHPKKIIEHLTDNPLIIGSFSKSILSSVNLRKKIKSVLKTPKKAGGNFAEYVIHKIKRDKKMNAADLVESMINTIFQEGLFSTESLESFVYNELRKFHVLTFEDIKPDLAIAALNIDSRKRAVFCKEKIKVLVDNQSEYHNIGVAQAVAASCAVPLLFSPFEYKEHCFIDGALCDTCLLDIGVMNPNVKAGIIFNPLEPVNNFNSRYAGPLNLLEQSYRLTIKSRLSKEIELAKIHYPDKELICISPPADRSYLTNPFRYEKVNESIVKYYLNTAELILSKYKKYSSFLTKVGIPAEREVLEHKVLKIKSEKKLDKKLECIMQD